MGQAHIMRSAVIRLNEEEIRELSEMMEFLRENNLPMTYKLYQRLKQKLTNALRSAK